MLTRIQAQRLITRTATASPIERASVLRRLLEELPLDLWHELGPSVVAAVMTPPGTAGRASVIELMALVPVRASYDLLRAVAADPDDPDREVAERALTSEGPSRRPDPTRCGLTDTFQEGTDGAAKPGGPATRGADRRSGGIDVHDGRIESNVAPGETPVPTPGEQAPTAPVHPRLDAPARVRPGEEFTVTVGMRRDADADVVSSGALVLPPGDVEVLVALQFDPEAFLLLPSAAGPQAGPWPLRRTAADPFPSVELRLIARAGDDLVPERRFTAIFLRDGQFVGFASRAVVVAEAAGPRRLAAASPPAGATRLHLDTPLAEEAADLVVVVQPSADVGLGRLTFTAYSQHPEVTDQAESLTRAIVGESRLGPSPAQLGREIRLKVSTTGDELDLFSWLRGLGNRVFQSMPARIRDTVREAVSLGTRETPATILLLTEEPYVPWELAVDPAGWPSDVGGESPFLGAHAAVSRWLLKEAPPPSPRPVAGLELRDKALVTAQYDGVVGWSPLPFAAEEVDRLSTALAPGVTVVPPVLPSVLRLVDGAPAADLLHFALHGAFDPQGVQGGLVLLGPESAGIRRPQLLQENHVQGSRLPRGPFVYLNACQVATGGSEALGDYGGLAVAFLAAGARAVLAPLWNIEDETASRLADEFYRLSRSPAAVPAAEILRRFRARYTLTAVTEGTAHVDHTLVAFQLFGHPRLRLRTAPGGAGVADDAEKGSVHG
jgi:hypothetical protein